LAREGGMLDKESTSTESAPVWRILRFFGLDNRSDKDSPQRRTAGPRSPKTESINLPSGIFLPLFSE